MESAFFRLPVFVGNGGHNHNMPLTMAIDRRSILPGLVFCFAAPLFCLVGCDDNTLVTKANQAANNVTATAPETEPAQPLTHHKPSDKNDLAVAVSSAGVFTLYAGVCSDEECTLEVRWFNNKDKYDSVKLEWGFQPADLEQQMQEEPWQNLPGLLTGAVETIGITVGEEFRAVTTSIQALDLAEGLPALLVRQRAGFEHLKRRFDLFVVENNRLSRIWSGDEGPGPWFSDVAIIETNNSEQQIVHFKGFAPPIGEEADTLEATLLRWSSNDNSLISEPADVPAIQIIPHFDSVSAARTARDQSSSCIGGYWILTAASLDQSAITTGGYALVGVAATKELAHFELARVRGCLKQGEPNLTSLASELD